MMNLEFHCYWLSLLAFMLAFIHVTSPYWSYLSLILYCKGGEFEWQKSSSFFSNLGCLIEPITRAGCPVCVWMLTRQRWHFLSHDTVCQASMHHMVPSPGPPPSPPSSTWTHRFLRRVSVQLRHPSEIQWQHFCGIQAMALPSMWQRRGNREHSSQSDTVMGLHTSLHVELCDRLEEREKD